MNEYALVRRKRTPSSPIRGIRLRVKKRAVPFFCRVKRRVSRALTQWCANMRKGFARARLRLGPGYARVREGEERTSRTPKGHLAVYVRPTDEGGDADGVAKRVVVPLIYINHPLFKRLLKDAEEKYGFDHPGGITIPCPVSEFETVKTRIAAGRARTGPFLPWVRNSP